MKYNSKISMIRYFKFNNKWILILRKQGCQARYYIDGLYMWTMAKGRHDGRLYQHNLGLKPNIKYDDWAPFSFAPDHIPNGQMWRYYFLKWEKTKDEIL